jgi:predicted lactoylglutathione lyase
MIRLDHVSLPVRDLAVSRRWYAENLGLTVEFEVAARKTVEAKHRELAARGVAFDKAPQKLFWGYGAELRDPDGCLIYLWDEQSMREKGGG